MKARATYLKTKFTRRGRSKPDIFRYYKIMDNGVLSVYPTATEVKLMMAFVPTQPYKVLPSNKREFDRQFKKTLKAFWQ